MPDPISRRQAITYGFGAVTAGSLAGLRPGSAAGPDRLLHGSAGRPRAPQERGLRQPIAISSRDGELAVRLTGRAGVVQMNAPKLVKTYTFDGIVPGYTWEVRPGDTLKVHLRNRLPHLPSMPMRMDRPHQFMSLQLKDHDFHVLAWDGLTLPAPDTTDVLMLSAGNRVEVLVKAGQPGVYDLVLTPGSSQQPNIPGMPPSGHLGPASGGMSMPGFPALKGELDKRTILTVEVSGHGPSMSLPTALPAWDPPIRPIARHRHFTFSVQRTPGNEFLNFGVDGKAYSMSAPPYQVPLGTAQEWTLENAFDPKLMEHAHVFHIHTNPFKITKRNGKALSPPLWRDTYVLTKSAGDTITFESNFVDYAGKFVEHCHVVSHEDLGMMSAIEVVDTRPGVRPGTRRPKANESE
jgi:FtsP/CotA-like multicopper oxidase with cupredoxin domain